MRIINLLDREAEDIEPPLRELASSEDRLQAIRGQFLLELVRYLQSKGDVPKAYGHVIRGKLWLSPANPVNRVSLTVWPDWYDYGPLVGGVPEIHYRLQIQRHGTNATTDARAKSHAEAEQIIGEAFGWA